MHNINWTFEQHKQYAAEQERRAQRENQAHDMKKEQDAQRRRNSR
jgi:hypothetical protein